MSADKPKFRESVEKALETVREGIAAHGGNIELVDADEATGVVTVRLQGACVGCPYADVTMKDGVESILCELVPGVREVRSGPAEL